MEDLFHRNIDYLRISVTDRCNFRCTYCMPQRGFVPMEHSEIMTYEEIVRLCGIFSQLGISKIKLTGGEPLVRKGFVSLVSSLHNIPGIKKVTMTTNGFLLRDSVEALKKAGLDGVNISLDTLNPEKFKSITGVDGLQQVLGAIDASIKEGILSVKINCVPMRNTNEDEIVALADMARLAPIEVRFIEMMPIGKGIRNNEITEDDMRKKLEEAFGNMGLEERKLGNGPATYYKPKDFAGHIGFISAMSHKFCSSCNRIRLTSDGILKPCLQYAGNWNIKELMRSGATDEKIEEVIRKVIQEKPECHEFQECDHIELKGGEDRVMTSIGG